MGGLEVNVNGSASSTETRAEIIEKGTVPVGMA